MTSSPDPGYRLTPGTLRENAVRGLIEMWTGSEWVPANDTEISFDEPSIGTTREGQNGITEIWDGHSWFYLVEVMQGTVPCSPELSRIIEDRRSSARRELNRPIAGDIAWARYRDPAEIEIGTVIQDDYGGFFEWGGDSWIRIAASIFEELSTPLDTLEESISNENASYTFSSDPTDGIIPHHSTLNPSDTVSMFSDGTNWQTTTDGTYTSPWRGNSSPAIGYPPRTTQSQISFSIPVSNDFLSDNQANVCLIRQFDGVSAEEHMIHKGATEVQYYEEDPEGYMEVAISYFPYSLPEVLRELGKEEKVTLVVDTCIGVDSDPDNDYFEATFLRAAFLNVVPVIEFHAGAATEASFRIVGRTKEYSLMNTEVIRINRETMEHEPND